jgi:hypothetical protein
MPREHQPLIELERMIVLMIVAFEAILPVDALLGADEASLKSPSATPLLACQPRNIARETSPGTPQIAVPRQIQRGGG